MKHISLEDLREPQVLLRPVRKDTIEFDELRRSIVQHGILHPPTVRPVEGGYEIVCGMHRFTIAKQLGFPSVNCEVRELSDFECLSLQLQENECHVKTDRLELARQLLRIQRYKPGITLRELASIACKSTQWVKDQLSLLDLCEDALGYLNRDQMPVMNAYALAKLPQSKQAQFVNDALLMNRSDFANHIREVQHETLIQTHQQTEYTPQAYLRSLKEIQEKVFPSDTPWEEVIAWVCHLDEATVTKKQHEYQQRKSIGKIN